MSIKVYLMAILDNYMFQPLLAIFRSVSKGLYIQGNSGLPTTRPQLKGRGTRLFITPVRQEPSNLTLVTRPYCASSHSIPPHREITLCNKALCTDLCTTCMHNVHSRTLSSLEDNLKMASKGRNM